MSQQQVPLVVTDEDRQRFAQFLYEMGTMRKLIRSHRQVLLTDDLSDNIAAHTFRVCMIGYVLARMEGVDPLKVLLMCLTHDTGEARTNDHNWVHKRYVNEVDTQIIEEQLGNLPFRDFFNIATEYTARESRESIVAKDADILDQILLLREYAHQGNREAQEWLEGKREPKQPYNYTKYLRTETAKALGRAIYEESPSSWWKNLYQHTRRV